MVKIMKNKKTARKIRIGLIVLLLLFSTFNPALFSQTKNVGIGTESPKASALLDLDVSNNTEFPTKKGLLIPRVALTGTNDNTTIPSPETSLLIYNTATASDVTPGFYYWSGTAWVKLKTAADAYPYLPLAGGSMTGAINMQNNIIENIGNTGTDFTASGGLNLADAVSATRFTSTVATGTSPFTIASNTLVANLNADLLDGNEATAFASSSHNHTGVYEPLLTKGNLTENVSSALTITGGTGAVIGAGTTIEVKNSTALWNANQLQGVNISSTVPTASQLLQFNGTEWAPATIASSGTVTSVGLSMPANEFIVSGSPVTENGTISVSWKNDINPSLFLCTPTNVPGTPEFRALTPAYIPNLPASKITEGTLPVAIGGTGATTLTGMLKGNGTSAFTGITATAGQLTYWSDANTIAGNSSITWSSNTLTIDGDLQVTGEIDPISLTLIPQTTAPTATEGKIYYDSTANGLKVYDGTEWVALGSGGGGGGLPSGSTNQTLRYNGTDWVASNALRNDGEFIGISSIADKFNSNFVVNGNAVIGKSYELATAPTDGLLIEGKVGIGTISPDSTLQVVGTAYFTSNTRIGENLLADGSVSYTPLTATSSRVNTAGKTYIKVDLTGTFTLSDGTLVGQVIILQVVSTGTTADLNEGGNCKITGNWSGSTDDIIQLIWDGSAWVEVSRSNN